MTKAKVTRGQHRNIISTVKNPISTKELLVRLQALADELATVDQDKVDLQTYQSVQRDLVNKKLIAHPNSGVQAYVCICISDILRINAPNAPFTAGELSDVFRAFFKQLRKLSDPENPYFEQQCYLLKRLAEVRSAILITDLPDSEHLIQLAFDTFYELASKDFPARLEPLASDILSEIVAESETIPHDVLRLILNRFLTYVPPDSALNSSIINTGFNFSISICESNLDRMSRLVAQYFSEMLYESTSAIEDQEKSQAAKGAKNLDKLNKIHRLSIQIWKYIPELLSSVIALIDDELNADDDKIRVLATETIGQMIGSNLQTNPSTSKVNFFIVHRDIWVNWLKKTTDISPQVRSTWAQQFPMILQSISAATTEINTALVNCLYKCLLDTDEKVREHACVSVSKIPFDLFTSRVCNKNIMNTLTHLTREKNSRIRTTVIDLFGSLYNSYHESINNSKIIDFGNHDEQESKELEKMIVEVIPNQILSLIYINDKSITASVDLCLFDKLLSISETSTAKRVDRMSSFFHSLDSKGKQSFLAINKRQQQVSKVVQSLLELADNSKSRVHEEKENIDNRKDDHKNSDKFKLNKILNWICVSFPDGYNTYACLERLFKLNKSRFFYLMKIANSPESDYSTVRNSMKELLSKLSDSKNIRFENERNNVSTKDMVYNVKLLLLRSSVLFYNKTNVVELIRFSKDPSHQWCLTANEILESISVTIPDVFKFHIKALTNLIISEKSDKENPKGLQLRVIYHFIKKYPDLFPRNNDFIETLEQIAVDGTPREAKYSIKILSLNDKNQIYFSKIISKIYPLNLEHTNFSTHLSTIAELFIVDPVVVQEMAADLTSLLIKEIFLKNRQIDKESSTGENEWIDDDTLDSNYKLHSTLYEKLLALRILVNRLIGLVDERQEPNEEEKEEITKSAQPVLKLLMSLIGNSGEIINKSSPSWPTPEVYKSKLRLTAGLLLLKLAKFALYSEMIHPTTIRRLTFLVSDSNVNVRSQFLLALQKKLVNELISERFLAVVFFCAGESNAELKSNMVMWIQSLYNRLQSKNNINFEKSLVRIIHMIAHHEHFLALLGPAEEGAKEPHENLVQAYNYGLKFIIFYTGLIAKQENISLLYYFASRVKQHRDKTIDQGLYDETTTPQQVLNIYRIAELTQFTLKEYSDHKSWPMQTWPGKLKLPSDIYTPMLSSKEAQAVVSTVYISDPIQEELRLTIRKKLLGVNQKRPRPSKDVEVKVKKQRPTNVSKPKKEKPKKEQKEQKGQKEPIEPTRKSSRTVEKISYEEAGSDEESDFESE